jgi:lipid II:glycine glycyltransferase (peptidoglycan interpeptide bridge formation enzyme)
MIHKLKHSQIDKKQWDEAITNSDNPHVYALSWYLDIISPGWECLIHNNYQVIMPLPVKQKLGVRYVVQPLFCQKIAVYGTEINNEQTSAFYKKLFRSFPYVNLSLQNDLKIKTAKYFQERINYTLNLSPFYLTLTKGFAENTIRNIRKAEEAEIKVISCSGAEFNLFCLENLKGLTYKEFEIFEKLVYENIKQGTTHILKAKNAQDEILATACFLVWNKQIVYLAGASSSLGKELSAMFLIFDTIIKEYASTGFLLDFEGSMIPGVARFFKGFGAQPSSYYHIKKFFPYFSTKLI